MLSSAKGGILSVTHVRIGSAGVAQKLWKRNKVGGSLNPEGSLAVGFFRVSEGFYNDYRLLSISFCVAGTCSERISPMQTGVSLTKLSKIASFVRGHRQLQQ